MSELTDVFGNDAFKQWSKYPTYKSPGVEWLGDIPEHWEVKKLKFLTKKIIDGSHFTPTYVNKGVPFLRVTDIQKESIDFNNVKQIPLNEHRELIKRCKPEKGDLLLSKNGTIGIPKIVNWDEEFSIFVSLCLIKIKNILHIDYVKYFFLSNQIKNQISFGEKTNTVTNLHLDKIKEFIFTLPLSEQKAIAHFLDEKTNKIDKLIGKKKRFIELLKEKRVALISHAVTKGLNPDVAMKNSGVEWLGDIPEHWEVNLIKRTSVIFIPQRNKPKLNLSEGIPWITIEDLTSNVVNCSINSYFVKENDAKNAGSKILPKGSVIASCIGEFGIASVNTIPIIINQQLQAYIPNRINSFYLRYLISISKCYFKQVCTSTTIVYVNQERFGELPVILPPLPEQKAIAQFLDKETKRIDEIVEKTERSIELLKEYKTALISAAVTGKIDVRRE